VGCQPELLAIGHGEIVMNPVNAMEKAINNLKRKIG
jgi:hypothetical protein